MNTVPQALKHGNNQKMPFVLAILGLIMVILAFIIGISDNLPGILLLLIGLCTFLYAFIYRSGGRRNLSTPKKLLYWTPRTLCIVFTIFTSFFAFDVFEESKSIWETILALLMHLIPTFILIVILVVTWRREWIGGILFIVMGLLYIVWAWGRFNISVYFLMAGPLIIIGILFLLNWKYRADLRPDIKE
jgi:drug/metabolite transporter (DMT)-like permease